MAKKYIDKVGFSYLWGKIKTQIDTKANSSDLKAVATSGKYEDLIGVPIIDKSISSTSDDNSVPSSKAVYDAMQSIDGYAYYATYGKDTISGVQKDNVFTLYECKNGAESVKSQFVIEGGEGGSGGSYRVAYGKTVVDGELKDNVFTLYETVDGVETVKNQFVIEGGGGGSTTAKTEITLKKVTPSPVIISTNGKAEVEVEYSSVDKNGETYDAIYTWTKDSKVLETGALVQGKRKFNLTKYISLGTQKLVLTVVDDTGNTNSQTWTIQQVDMRITSSFNDNNTFPIGRSVAYTFTPYGAIDKTVHFELDGAEDTMSVSSTGTPLSYTIPPQSHGAHSFKVWMTATDIPNLKTECLYYDIIWFDSGLTEPIISCIYRNDFYGVVDARQYDTTSIEYTVYDPTTESPIVKRYADGELVNTDTLTKPTNEWKYKSDKIGEHTLIIEVGDNTEDGGWIVRDSVTIVMNINPLGIDVTPITANLEVDFNPIGITNNSSNRVWSNEKYHMTVSDNFDWINGGYKTDENGDTYFLVKAGTEAVLHYNIFSGDNSSSPSTFGAEMKIIFMTENVQKANAVWLKSVEQSNNSVVGIQMGVHEGWLKTNTASNVDVVGDNDSSFVAATNTYLYMPYSEEDIIEMDINIDPIDREMANPQAFVMAYEDGVPSKAFVYGSSDRFYHFEPKPITIGSNDCDVRIYRLKIYSSSLSTEDVMKNFIADSRDSTTMLQRYDRNSVYYDRETDTYTPYSSGGILDPEKLAPMIPNVKVLMLETDHFTTSKKNFVKAQLRCIHAVGGDKYSGDPYYDNWLFEDGWHAGQGTTSDKYGNAGRNVDFLFNCDGIHKPSDKVAAEEGYISRVTLGYGTDNPTTESVTNWKGDDGKVDLTRTSVPNNFFNLKVNIASSENVNNALLQKRYNDYLPYISPAKKRDSRIKNDMEFVPAVLFLKETNPDIDTHNEFLDNEFHFYALGNIGDSKKTDYTRAYDPDDMNEFTIEISDNTKNNSTFQTGIESLGDGQYRMETFKLIKTLDADGEVVLTPIAYTPVRNHILNIPESILDEYWNAQGEIVTENNTGNPEYDGNEFGYLNMRRWCLENEAFDGDNSFEPRYACCGDYRDGKLVNDTSGRGKAQVKVNNDVWRAFYKWVITSTDDEFKNELDQWCVRSAVEFFYAFTHIYTMMDNRAKNTFWHFAKTGVYHEVSKPVTELLHIYCELVDGEYITTSDTEIHSDKTYYTQYAFDLWDYDNDTAIGINNNGELVFPYGREDTDYNIEGNPSSGYVFNGATSAFWCRLRNLLSPEISDTFKNVQKECFSANHLIKEFDAFQECYPEEIWRLDVQRKYIRTFTGESIDNSKPKHDVQYLRDMMQGRKKYQRRQWVRDQEIYFGTKHELSTVINNENQITFRCYTPGGDDVVIQPNYTLKITPFSDMYLVLEYSNSDKRTKNPPIRAKAGVEQEVLCPLSNMDDTMVAIYCANRISALGDLSACYIAANNFSMATKLKKLVLGNSTPGYNNARLTSLSLGNNTLLEELDITNCQNLSGAMDFNQYNNLTTFLAKGTSITSVVFAPSGKIKTAYLPDTVNTLEMQNLDKLTDFKASLDSLEKLTLRGGIISHKELLDKCIDTLKELYLYDINWTGVNSLPDTSLINQLLPSGALQNNLTNMFSSKITGFAYIDNEVHNRELVAYAKTWRDLEVRSASIIPQFSIKFVNYDGSLLDEQIIDRNEDAVEPIAAGNCSTPIKPSDGMYDYTFAGWDDTELTNITSNKTIQAQYSREAIQYTITFDTNGGTELASITQGYGTTIVLPTITTKVGHTLIGWEPALPATMPVGGLHVVAQWQINQYTITFNTDGGNSIPAITQDYGTYVTRPADPTRKGYTFISWDKEIPATIPDQNITIKALWQINTYRVRYINGSTVLQTYEAVPYQTSVSYTGATPTWIGDGMGTFNGWSHDGTNIEQDTDIYAVYINVVLVPSSVKSLANCTWDEIKVMAKDGYLNSSRQWCYNRNGKEEVWFNIGDTKEVELTDGEKLVFQIWDFKHDPTVSSNGNETAAFTFGMAGLTKTTHSSGNLTTTWPESNIRTQVIPQYYDKLPKLLKSNITSVWKKAREKRSSKNILSYQERLFIPAVCEVRDGYGNAGAREWTDEHEGTKYPIFSDNASRAKGDIWFTRSVFSDRYSREVFGYIKADGGQDWGSYNCKLCLCFCI